MPLAAVGGLGLDNAGYFPTTWGWSAAGFGLATAAALIAQRELHLSPLGVAFVGSVVAVIIWNAVSIGWSISVPRSVAELERGLVYLSCIAALLALARSRASLLAGALAGATLVCIDALVQSRLHRAPDRFEGTLLFRPVGYANGLAVIAAIGLVIALGLSVRGATRTGRALAAASTAPLAAALVLTHSTGAYFALALAFVAGLLLERYRLAAASSAAPALATTAAATAAAVAAGPGTLWLLVFVAIAAPLGSLATRQPRRPDGRIVIACTVVLVLVALPAAAVRHGSAVGDRTHYWHAGFSAYAHARVAGTGAGTFALDWLAYRDRPIATRNAHSLEIETLAELGPVGVILVLAMLAIPLGAALRSRDDPIVPVATAAFLVLAIHAAIDWDWQQPAVWLGGMTAAVVLVTAEGGPSLPRLVRWAGALAFVVLSVAAAAGLRGNMLVADSHRALHDGHPDAAAKAASGAARWQPWASDPLFVQGEAAFDVGNAPAALAFTARSLTKDPHDPRLWLALAGLSRPDVAQAARVTAARLDPLGVPLRKP